jgi:hypothetical protein
MAWDREKAERENNSAILRHEQEVAAREIRSERRGRDQRESADQAWYGIYDELEAEELPLALQASFGLQDISRLLRENQRLHAENQNLKATMSELKELVERWMAVREALKP